MNGDLPEPVFSPNTRRLFVIVEVLAVLVIIAVSLNAFWRAAGSVYRNVNVSHTSAQIRQITGNLRALYAGQPKMDGGLSAATLINAGAFPVDMVREGKVFDLWGGEVWIEPRSVSAADDSFIIAFSELTVDDCRSLVEDNLGNNRMEGLVGAVSSLGFFMTEFPPPPAIVEKACAGNAKTIGFVYKLKI